MKGVIDKTDYEIIAALHKGAKTPFRKISKRVHMSESAVRKRVKRLERAGHRRQSIEAGLQHYGHHRFGCCARKTP